MLHGCASTKTTTTTTQLKPALLEVMGKVRQLVQKSLQLEKKMFVYSGWPLNINLLSYLNGFSCSWLNLSFVHVRDNGETFKQIGSSLPNRSLQALFQMATCHRLKGFWRMITRTCDSVWLTSSASDPNRASVYANQIN